MFFVGEPAPTSPGTCASVPVPTLVIPLQHVRLQASEPKGHWQLDDSSAALDLTFLRRTRCNTGRNVKSAALVASGRHRKHAARPEYQESEQEQHDIEVALRDAADELEE